MRCTAAPVSPAARHCLLPCHCHWHVSRPRPPATARMPPLPAACRNRPPPSAQRRLRIAASHLCLHAPGSRRHAPAVAAMQSRHRCLTHGDCCRLRRLCESPQRVRFSHKRTLADDWGSACCCSDTLCLSCSWSARRACQKCPSSSSAIASHSCLSSCSFVRMSTSTRLCSSSALVQASVSIPATAARRRACSLRTCRPPVRGCGKGSRCRRGRPVPSRRRLRHGAQLLNPRRRALSSLHRPGLGGMEMLANHHLGEPRASIQHRRLPSLGLRLRLHGDAPGNPLRLC